MKEAVFYEAVIEESAEILEFEKILYTLFQRLRIDLFDTARFVADVIDTIHEMRGDGRAVSTAIHLGPKELKVRVTSDTSARQFVFSHTTPLGEEALAKLKEEIFMLSKSALIALMQNKEEMEKMLKEKLKRLNKELFDSAYYDALTALPNRAHFFDRLEETVSLKSRSKEKFSLMFIDLDGFKFVNDHYGHDAGDEVLKKVAERLKAVLRKHDFIARLGGDEFVAIISDFREKEELAIIARKIIEAIEEPIELAVRKSAEVSASVGIVVYPDDADDQETLLKYADTSMYEVKKRGKGDFVFFDRRMEAQEL